jgi:hypothetical protein
MTLCGFCPRPPDPSNGFVKPIMRVYAEGANPMTMTADRIAQFEKMAREDATNDMAHFSLGNAYLQGEPPRRRRLLRTASRSIL